MTKAKDETTHEHLFVAVLLRTGGIDLNEAEIARAKTHKLVVTKKEQLNGPTLTSVGAEAPPPAK